MPQLQPEFLEKIQRFCFVRPEWVVLSSAGGYSCRRSRCRILKLYSLYPGIDFYLSGFGRSGWIFPLLRKTKCLYRLLQGICIVYVFCHWIFSDRFTLLPAIQGAAAYACIVLLYVDLYFRNLSGCKDIEKRSMSRKSKRGRIFVSCLLILCSRHPDAFFIHPVAIGRSLIS